VDATPLPPDLPPPREPEPVPVIPLPSSPTKDPRELVAEAMHGIVVEKVETARIREEMARPSLGRIGLVTLGVGALVTLFGWAVSQSRFVPPERTPARVEDELRYGTWLAAERIDRFVAQKGRLPSDARELGYAGTWLQYTRGDSAWTLTARDSVRQVTVILRSVDDRGRFLNDADKRILKP
jgi:hypothetical protein